MNNKYFLIDEEKVADAIEEWDLENIGDRNFNYTLKIEISPEQIGRYSGDLYIGIRLKAVGTGKKEWIEKKELKSRTESDEEKYREYRVQLQADRNDLQSELNANSIHNWRIIPEEKI